MKLHVADREAGRFTFRFEPTEREWFSRILEMYPVQNEPVQAQADAEKQDLLEKAFAESRTKLREEAEAFLRSGSIEIDKDFSEFWHLRLTAAQIEELLQILNNIRIGLWIKLGKPDPNEEPPSKRKLSDDLVRAYTIMHVCAAWQGVAMEAVNPDSSA